MAYDFLFNIFKCFTMVHKGLAQQFAQISRNGIPEIHTSNLV